MKRDIKLNMAQLAETCYAIRVHKNNMKELRTVCHVSLRVMERQKSESFEALSGQMRDVIIKMINDALHRMDDLETILSEYIEEMKEHISPQNEGMQMRVDRNDIWKNIIEIRNQELKLTEMRTNVCGNISLPDYRLGFADPDTKEGQAILMAQQMEQQRRERNYAKIEAAWSRWTIAARAVMESSLEGIWGIYNNSIIPFENADDAYKKEVLDLDGLWGYAENFAAETLGYIKGMGYEAVAGMDLILSFQSFSFVFMTLPGAISYMAQQKLPLELPLLEPAFDHAEGAWNMLLALPKILKDPGAVLDAVGQSLMDTYDEEGIGYAVGSIEFQLMVNILMGACTREMSGELLQTIRSLRGTRGRAAGHIVTETLGGQLDDAAWGGSRTISQAERMKIDGWQYSPSDELYLKYKDVYDNPIYYDQTTGEIHWPPNDGFIDGTARNVIIEQNTFFKRYGENTGEFLGNVTDSFESRALAPHSENAEIHYYRLLEDYEMTMGEVAGWFGSDGGAEQFVIYKTEGGKYTIKELEDAGILEDITDLVEEGEIIID